jgi:hypothetical protein
MGKLKNIEVSREFNESACRKITLHTEGED